MLVLINFNSFLYLQSENFWLSFYRLPCYFVHTSSSPLFYYMSTGLSHIFPPCFIICYLGPVHGSYHFQAIVPTLMFRSFYVHSFSPGATSINFSTPLFVVSGYVPPNSVLWSLFLLLFCCNLVSYLIHLFVFLF